MKVFLAVMKQVKQVKKGNLHITRNYRPGYPSHVVSIMADPRALVTVLIALINDIMTTLR